MYFTHKFMVTIKKTYLACPINQCGAHCPNLTSNLTLAALVLIPNPKIGIYDPTKQDPKSKSQLASFAKSYGKYEHISPFVLSRI